jgi:SAM-dependent methyltransferase/ADP-ribose pyrophosphatase YjhB (NUDIX family)
MADVLSLGVFERGHRALLARRGDGQPPFAGNWLLPGAAVGATESAEEALRRHAFQELGVTVEAVEFAETLYLEDSDTHQRYVANVFLVLRQRGRLRFRAAGQYEDARWLNRAELSDVAMPDPLRDWLKGSRRPKPAAPDPVPLPAVEETPDNRQAWNTISRAYQNRYRLPTDRLVYGGRCPDESELQLLGDVAGLNVIVLGCGGGQDCVVLARQGARVTGVDLSDEQIEYARRLAERKEVNVTLFQGSAEELKEIADESQDLAVSIHALNYVERADRAFAEAYRVLRRGAPLVMSVHHAFDSCLEDTPPYGIARSYWQSEQDWRWDFPDVGAGPAVSARLRVWYRPVSEWFTLLSEAGFRVERLLEPPPTAAGSESQRALGSSGQKRELVPETLIIKAVRP